MNSLLYWVRKLEKGIAEEHNLSTFERAEFRIRLSRFDIVSGRGDGRSHLAPGAMFSRPREQGITFL